MADGDSRWLMVLATATAVESLWWSIAWLDGIAPLPFVFSYLGLAGLGLAAALTLKRLLTGSWPIVAVRNIIAAALLIGLGASLFLPLKYAIPSEVPFWADRPLAALETRLFGEQPWLIADHLFGWAAVPLDRLYSLWLPVQSVTLFLVILARPSRAKSRALIAFSFAWFVLGVAAAAIFSSAGPLFYDRLFGGATFAQLRPGLLSRGAWVAVAESDRMWASYATARPGFVAGISAVPSMHVAISLWIWLAARSLAPRLQLLALVYLALITVGSVQLGWHYVGDGVVAVGGMLAIWKLAAIVDRALFKRTAGRVRLGSHNRLKFWRTKERRNANS